MSFSPFARRVNVTPSRERRARPGRLLGAAGALLLAIGTRAAPAPGLAEFPLAERVAAPGAKLFTAVPAEQTGIVVENRYADPAMWGERYQEFAFGSLGTGVAIGDYDGDGRPDVLVVSKTEESRLFRNLGGWRFEDVTEKAGLRPAGGAVARGLAWASGVLGNAAPADTAWKQGAAFADVNNDGRLDLYICRFDAPNLLYINRGDGTFREEAAARGLAVKDASVMAAFADYDRDGWLDVYLLTNLLSSERAPGGQRDRLFHNNGDGTFVEVTDRAGITGEGQGHSATWWDYDEDGWPDLYVANDFAPADRLYRNNRDGTFTDVLDRVAPHTPFSSMGADIADLNNDGRLDLLVGDMAATTHEKDQRAMAEMRGQLQEVPIGAAQAPQQLRNALFLNQGGGAVVEGAELAGLAATDWTWSVRLEDFDNDGRVDVHATTGMVREAHNTDLLFAMMSSERFADRARLMRTSPVLAEANLAFANRGDLRFENVSAAWGLDDVGVSFGAATGDLDGDGDLDLVYGNFERGPTVLRNNGTSGHRVMVELRGAPSNRLGVGATVRIETEAGVQVRTLTLARGYLSTSEPVLHFGLGDVARLRRLTVTWPDGATQAYDDLAADRRYVITETRGPAAAVAAGQAPAEPALFTEAGAAVNLVLTAREEGLDETAQQPLLPTRFNRRGPALALGDLDGDGRDDVVLGGTTRDPARVAAGGAGGTFGAAQAVVVAAGPASVNDGPVLVFDADGDGRQDLLVTKGGVALPAGAAAYRSALYLNRAAGGLQPAPAGAWPDLPIAVGAAVAADFNRDGRLDVFVGGRVVPGKYPATPRSALLVNRGGRFEEVTDDVAPGLSRAGLVAAALWSDVDGDGWVDLVVACEWGGVRCWRNERGERLVERSEELGFTTAGTGWWTALAAADFNGDGRLDYVVGNAGLNTPYSASAAAPAVLYYGAFGPTTAPQIVEAYHEGDRLLPRRNRKQLAAKIPAVSKKFPKSDLYARATLPEILGEPALAAAQRFVATELRSGVLLSQAGGTFIFVAAPRLAQIAPWQGLATGDFDGDGHADIVVAQNSFAPVAAVGRFDGGLGQMLRGDGRGGFAAVELARSGLLIPGDAKALVVTDLNHDGWPDVIVSRNQASTLVFRNRGNPDRRSLGVRLRGAPGNPTAVGARVTVGHADGATQTAEIAAGGGYASQGSATVFFGATKENPWTRLTVRWPDGATTVRALTARGGVVVIER